MYLHPPGSKEVITLVNDDDTASIILRKNPDGTIAVVVADERDASGVALSLRKVEVLIAALKSIS